MSNRNPRRAGVSVTACALALLACLDCGSNVSSYEPDSDNGAIIYHEACARCHDDGSFAPLILRGDVRDLTREKIVDALAAGREGMPSYPLIEGEYLDALVEFILGRQYDGGP